ncbi:TPA: DNA/RNA non-specific endonuclease [Streptococcus suis]
MNTVGGTSLYSENEILNQLKLNRSNDFSRLLEENGIKINGISFNDNHNYYDISADITIDNSFYKLKKGVNKKGSRWEKGNKVTVKDRKKHLIDYYGFAGFGDKCHRGHLLARQLKDYVEFTDFNFSKNNPNNIYPQWINANLNKAYRSEIYGQAHFENKIIEALEKNKTITYAVKPIFTKSNKYFPVGNLIISILEDDVEKGDMRIIVSGDKKEEFCVLIPNYLDTDILPE